MDRLPAVMPSSGLRSVAAEVIRTRPTSTSSSSAAICASAVRTPWPSSTLPDRTSTVPSARSATSRPGVGWPPVSAAAPCRCSRGAPAHLGRGREHCADHAVVRAAAAQVLVEGRDAHRRRTDRGSRQAGARRARRSRTCSSRTARPDASTIERATGCGSPSAPRPSTVVTSLPSTDQSGVSHE